MVGNKATSMVEYSDGSVKVSESIITIFEKEIMEYAVQNNISSESSLAGTFGHEVEHTTDANAQIVSN